MGIQLRGLPTLLCLYTPMVNGEVYAHEECARLLLEGEVTERVRGENDDL